MLGVFLLITRPSGVRQWPLFAQRGPLRAKLSFTMVPWEYNNVTNTTKNKFEYHKKLCKHEYLQIKRSNATNANTISRSFKRSLKPSIFIGLPNLSVACCWFCFKGVKVNAVFPSSVFSQGLQRVKYSCEQVVSSKSKLKKGIDRKYSSSFSTVTLLWKWT